MTQRFTNNFNLPMSVAVWLLNDSYNHEAVADPNTFSVTEIIKPVRQIVLGRRANALEPEEQLPVDVSAFFNSRVGQSVHSVIEEVWLSDKKLPELMSYLGIPQHVSSQLLVNPSDSEIDEDSLYLFMEQRRTVEIDETYKLTGQYDFNFCGQLEDFKFTKTYAMTMGVNDDYYIKQGSCYKFLFPDQITSDTTRITWMFGDWMQSRVGSKNYPPAPLDSREFPLMSQFQTDAFIRDKFKEIDTFKDAPETSLPECSPEDLWQDPTVWKYYANPANKSRATKNFTEADGGGAAAAAHKAKTGKGVVEEVKGKIKACRYCKGFPLCTQKDKYLLSGQLDI